MFHATPTVFDCLLACLRFRMLTYSFCIECLFFHRNGMGLNFGRFLKTALSHLVCYGRVMDKDPYVPICRYEKRMDFKIKRIWWGFTNQCFKHVCYQSSNGLKENVVYRSLNYGNNGLPFGVNACPDQGILRWLDTVSKITVTIKCGCRGGASRFQMCYIGFLRKNKRSNALFSIILAKWNNNGDKYEDPLWNFSLFGDKKGSNLATVLIPKTITGDCPKCGLHVNVHDVCVPETTWLFMADFTEAIQKDSVSALKNIDNYILDGVVFYLAFILVYNTETGHFTSINIYDKWRFFDDSHGGALKHCNPSHVDYAKRWNVRAFYFRRTDSMPHRCLVRASKT